MADGDPKAIGARLRAERLRRSFARPAMAREIAAHLPDRQRPSIEVLISYLKRWEAGKTGISLRYRLACSQALGIAHTDLFGLPPELQGLPPELQRPPASPAPPPEPQRPPASTGLRPELQRPPASPGPPPVTAAPAPGTVEDPGTSSDWDAMERRRLLQAALGVSAGALASPLLDPEAQSRLTWAEQHPGRAGAADVESVAGVLAAQRHAEDTLGSAALVGPVTAQFAVVAGMAAQARGPVRAAMVDIAQQWAQYTAWLHMSVRDFAAARALWRQTLELAAEAGDVTMTATALTYQAEMSGWGSPRPGPMIGLAQAAQRDSRATAAQRAYSASIEAWGHALAGAAAAAERKLGEAEELARTGLASKKRPWLYWCTPQVFQGQRGIALGHLAGRDPRYAARAVEALTACHTGLSPEIAQSEWGISFLMYRAEVHALTGDVGQACADAMLVAPAARQLRSVRLGQALAKLHTGLAAKTPRDPRVTELAAALR